MRPLNTTTRKGIWKWILDNSQQRKGKERQSDEEYYTLLANSDDGRHSKHPGTSSSVGMNIDMQPLQGSSSTSLRSSSSTSLADNDNDKPYKKENNHLYAPPAENTRHSHTNYLRRTLACVPSRLGFPLALKTCNSSQRFPGARKRSICISVCVYALYLAAGIPMLLLLAVLMYGGIPPSYSALRKAERALPQHHWGWDRSRLGLGATGCSLQLNVRGACTDGTERLPEEMYLRFPDNLWGHGFNNILQERILTTHLTLSTNRTPVFEDYTWSKLPLPYTVYDFALRPTRIPLGAFVGGVLSGQETVREQELRPTRRAVSAEYFEFMCPPSEVVEIPYRWPWAAGDSVSPSTYVHKDPFPSNGADGTQIINWFKTRLDAPDVRGKRCVVVREERKIFDLNFFGGGHMSSILPHLIAAPVLKQFAWSSLVLNAIERNVERYFGVVPTLDDNRDVNATPNGTIPGVLALHLRRGDYERHCRRLNRWGAGYMGVLGMLKDKFNPDAAELVGGPVRTEEERQERRERYYLKHCLPDIGEVVEKLRVVREEYELENGGNRRQDEGYTLRQVYVFTNAWPSFLVELREALLKDGWERVLGTADLEAGVEVPPPRASAKAPSPGTGTWDVDVDNDIIQGLEESNLGGLNRDERGAGVAIDMGIAERTQAFVGNGFSSLSANIVILRVTRGFAVGSNWLL